MLRATTGCYYCQVGATSYTVLVSTRSLELHPSLWLTLAPEHAQMHKCTNAQMHKCTGTLTPDFEICQFCPKSASQPPSSPPPLDPSERVRRIAPLSCPCPAQPSSMDARICHAIHTKYQSTCDKLATYYSTYILYVGYLTIWLLCHRMCYGAASRPKQSPPFECEARKFSEENTNSVGGCALRYTVPRPRPGRTDDKHGNTHDDITAFG